MKSCKVSNIFLAITCFILVSCGNSNRDQAFQSIEEAKVDSTAPKVIVNIETVKIGDQVWAKENLNVDKVVVFQPFGRSTQAPNGFAYDSSGRSFETQDAAEIIKRLQKKKKI